MTPANVDDLRQRQRYDRPSNLQKVDQKIQGEETNSSTGRLHGLTSTVPAGRSRISRPNLPKEVPEANEGLATLPDPQKPGELVYHLAK